MSLKRSHTPEYRLTLPLTKKRVAYSPFNMKSERTLMLATQSQDMGQIIDSVINVLNDNIKTDGINAEELPQAELELLLIQMRGKSVGEEIELNITDPEDGKVYPVSVDLTEITVETDKEFKDVVKLTDGTVIKFRLPTIRMTEVIDTDNEFDSSMKIICDCVVSVVDGQNPEEVYSKEDVTEEELMDFFMSLSQKEFNIITDQFFSKIPKLSTVVSVPREGKEPMEVRVEGLANFL